MTRVENKLAVIPSRDIIDESIEESIMAALDRLGSIQPGDITVQVENRVVTLSGTVPDYRTLQAIRNIAAHTLGVVDVQIRLVIASARESAISA